MLAVPTWRPELRGEECRLPRWISTESFAPYVARPIAFPTLHPQIEDSESCGSLSPERSTDSGSDNDFVCEWRGCGSRFDSVARLSAHVARIHAHAHPDGYFYCCWRGCARSQRGFNARYKMIVHMRIHTNERPHVCSQCQKSFSRAENLKIHLRSHSGEKPYVCPYEGCGKAYSNSSDRFKHTRTHKVDKPYCCKAPGCNKRYTDPSSLRKHVKAYNHLTKNIENPKQDASPPSKSGSLSPISQNSQNGEPISHPDVLYHHRLISPTIPYPRVTESIPIAMNYIALMDQPTYITPAESVYLPSEFTRYSNMYDHTYRNYYSMGNCYPILKPLSEKINYEKCEKIVSKMEVETEVASVEYNQNIPLNLMCTKKLDCRPIEELVKYSEPLDLRTKS